MTVSRETTETNGEARGAAVSERMEPEHRISFARKGSGRAEKGSTLFEASKIQRRTEPG
jgi:hypothetical protein